MSYEDAHATALIATRCAICNRELLDVVSASSGLGPVCRSKNGYDVSQAPALWPQATAAATLGGCTLASLDDARRSANVLIHRIAADPQSPAVPHLLAAVSALGFAVVAEAIASNLCPLTVRVEAMGERVLAVKIDRDEMSRETFDRFVEAMRGVPGRWWSAPENANLVPVKQKVALWDALKSTFAPGTVVIGQRIAVL